MTKKPSIDPVMQTLNRIFKESGKTLDEVGMGMGYAPDMARKSAWQFLRQTSDPRLSMLRKFAKSMGLSVKDLFD